MPDVDAEQAAYPAPFPAEEAAPSPLPSPTVRGWTKAPNRPSRRRPARADDLGHCGGAGLGRSGAGLGVEPHVRIVPATLAPLVTMALAGPMLIAILWLIVQRTSRAEQRRFAMTAHDMRVEAMALERAVEAIGQALAANRSELSAQAVALSEMAQAPKPVSTPSPATWPTISRWSRRMAGRWPRSPGPARRA